MFLSYSIWHIITALLVCLLYFLISEVKQKSGRRSILPAIQIYLIFSTIPYVLSNLSLPFFNAQFHLSISSIILLYCISIFPELFAFVGIICLRKNYRLLNIVLISIAIGSAIEIYPIRTAFRFDSAEHVIQRLHDAEHMKPFCTNDRKFEIKRSIGTIKQLIILSKNSSNEHLRKITLKFPNLKTKPDMLKLGADWQWMPYEYWDDNRNPAFIEKVFNLDTILDSDGDGLSDFREAVLLTDAYNIDTDDDGIFDKKDSDPLNPFIESEIAHMNAAIIEYWMADLWCADEEDPFFCDVINHFYSGKGEIANFSKHVLLMSGDHRCLWYLIFEDLYRYGPPDIQIGRPLFDFTRRIVVVDITCSSGGGMLLLIKRNGKWQVIAWRGMWI